MKVRRIGGIVASPAYAGMRNGCPPKPWRRRTGFGGFRRKHQRDHGCKPWGSTIILSHSRKNFARGHDESRRLIHDRYGSVRGHCPVRLSDREFWFNSPPCFAFIQPIFFPQPRLFHQWTTVFLPFDLLMPLYLCFLLIHDQSRRTIFSRLC